MKLDTWMTKNGISDAVLARAVGVHRSTIGRIRRRKQMPTIPIADRIQKYTSGRVDAIRDLGCF